jgi:hypothetical protein
MQRLLLVLAAAALVFGQKSSAPNAESRALFSQIDGIMSGLSEITGWKIKHKVKADFISRDELRKYVQKRLREVVKPEEIRIEALTLKMFGLVPDEFDLEKAVVDLVTEQAAAFYDYNRKRLFITENPSTFIEQRIVLVHELAHALADQQHSLTRYIHKGGKTDDEATAREAVLEGQATWLMWALSSKLNGGDAEPSEIILDTMRNSSGGGGAQFPVFENAPLYLRESLMFPYNQGLLFQDAVFRRLGRSGFSEVFRNAPRTSAQILHPQLYFDRATPPDLHPPEPAERKRYRTLAEGSLGEFDHRILIEQYGTREEAMRLSPHWRGGEYRLYEHKKTRKPVLTWVSEWATESSAREWFEAARRVIEGKSKHEVFEPPADGQLGGLNERGRFRLWLRGRQVSAVEGN